jgi:putative membrane protein
LRQMLLRWVLGALGLWIVIGITNVLIPDSIKLLNWWAPLVLIAVLGFINSFIRPLLKLLMLPLNCLTFGLVGIFLNLILFYLCFRMTPGIQIEWSFRTFMAIYIGMVVVSVVVNHLIKKKEEPR